MQYKYKERKADVSIFGNLRSAIKSISNTISDFFSQEKVAEDINVLHIEKDIAITSGLCIKESRVLKFNNALERCYRNYTVTSSTISEIYSCIPDELVEHIREQLAYSYSITGTYEEIIKYYMDLAKSAYNPIVRGIDYLPKVDSTFGKNILGGNDLNVGNKSLVIIWCSMILHLLCKYHSNTYSNKDYNICKMAISFAFATGVIFIQFSHKIPGTPSNYAKIIYSTYNRTRKSWNYIFKNKIPDIFHTDINKQIVSDFSNNERLKMGQVLNMVFTFRVGDSLVLNLENWGNPFNLISHMTNAIFPMPTESDLKRMFKLYTDGKLYKL